ncbi:MAG: hypothetical protein FWC26_13100 [Fibromonadales bacterium]|nr:hypothetical protein [Fibromonadales bacterium]
MQTTHAHDAFGPLLNDEAVLKIAQQRSTGVVSLAALDCNWTANAEKNYFNIWAAVSFHQRKDRMFLQGGRFCNWNLEYEMKLVCTEKNMSLYSLSLNNRNEFPNEFVIRLDRESGEHLYDNNDYLNYSIEHSQGRFATAIAQGSKVFSFDTIVPIKIYV